EQRRYRAAWAASRIGESAVPALISATRDESALVRAASLDALGWMDEAPDEIVPCLASSLQDEQTEVQIQAAKSLVKRLPESVEPTVAALGHKEGRVREIAAKGLAQLDAIPVTAQPLLLELTRDQDSAVRAAAVLAIGNAPIAHAERVRVIGKAIVDEDLEVRGAAVLALRKSGSGAVEFIEILVPLLANDDAQTRASAAFALGSLGSNAAPAVKHLIAAIRESPESEELSDEEREIVSALSRIGAVAVPDLLLASSESETGSRALAIALASIGPEATSPLVSALAGDSLALSVSAARALGEMDPIPPSAITPLINSLDSPSKALKRAALEGLGKCSDLNPAVVKRFRQYAEDEDAGVRAAAILAMAKREPKSSELTQALRAGVNDADATVRVRAIEGLAIQGVAANAIEELVQALEDSHSNVRLVAVTTLSESGEAAQPTVGKITSLLSDGDAEVRAAAAEAIGQIGTNEASVVTKLSRSLQDQDSKVLLASLNSLAALGEASKTHTQEVWPLLEHPDAGMRSAALKCLAAVDGEAATPILIELLSDRDWTVRRDSAESLGKIGSKAKAAVPTLFRMLTSEDDRDAARGALRAIDDAGPEAVPVLVGALESDDRRQRYYAMFLLGKVGPAAKDALPAIRRLLEETDSDRFRGSIQQTIDRIEGDK
ncbi:MAG: HEAT repeat domain-containing protein, partial [Rubripirellula sp.]